MQGPDISLQTQCSWWWFDHLQCCIHSPFLLTIKKIIFLLSFPISMLFSFSVNIERITTIERVFKFLQFSITSLLHRTYWFFKRGKKQFCRLYQKYEMWQLTEYIYYGQYWLEYIYKRDIVKRMEFPVNHIKCLKRPAKIFWLFSPFYLVNVKVLV